MACRYSAVALDDLTAIASTIARDNPKRARSFVTELRATCATLGTQPGMGRLRNELGEGVRLFPHGNYVILFAALTGGGVRIERVLHGARDLSVAVKS